MNDTTQAMFSINNVTTMDSLDQQHKTQQFKDFEPLPCCCCASAMVEGMDE